MNRSRYYTAVINPLFYVSALIFYSFCALRFFFGQNFFGSNSTDLHYFFKAIPFAGIIVFPVLAVSSVKNDFYPMKDYSLIFFRWLTVFLQYCAMLLPLIFIPVCVNFFGKVDGAQVFTGFAALLLYGAASLSVCVFISYLVNSGAGAFILSAICLVITNVIHLIPLYSTSNAVNSIVRKISFSWHFDAAGKGILDTRDIFYYVFICVLFMFFSYLLIQHRKGKKYSKKEALQVVSVFLIILFGFIDSSRFYLRKDISSNQKYTVSGSSRELFKNLEDNLNITYYRSSVLTNLYPQVRDVADYLQEYSSSKRISFRIEDPDKTGVSKVLENYGIYSRQIQSYGNNQSQFINVYSAIVMEYLGKWEVIPFVLGADSLEYDLDGRLLHLISGKSRIVNILCGNGMSLEDDYSYLVPWLNNQGFICNQLKLDSEKSLEEQFNSESSLLFVIGSSILSESHCRQIENILLNGANALIMTSPYSASIQDSWYIKKDSNQNLISMLEFYGLGFSENLAADISCARIIMESNKNADGDYLDSTFTQNINYPLWVSIMPQKNAKQGITLFWPSVMTTGTDEITPLLYSTKGAWQLKPDKYSSENLFVTNPFQTQELLKEKKDTETLEMGLCLIGKLYGVFQNGLRENAMITVIPDQYFVNSLMLGYIGGSYGDYRNLDFTVNQLLKLNGEEELSMLQEKASYSTNSTMYKITDEIQFNEARKATLLITLILIPFLMISAFILMIILRKKHIEELCNV